ncbi:hypothetical protein J437_LFUL015736 [Ladona fulva]|uniref:Uncharacterized protein n=1 Tax=Ladona fulva TaxID=123851 RepID=A0A8K0KNW9_LADFU|nr:hypothetical protein J437_LFUL015736 [Ladona fulva]
MEGRGSKLLLLFWFVAVAFVITADYGPQRADAAKSDPYCFSFTWLGPKWNNESQGNGTCEKIDPKPEVCIDPLVITYDGTPPNMTYLWKHFNKTQIGCRLTDSEACAKFTYYYNGKVDNITYMCARIIVDGDASMTSGCETADVGGYVKEVCACRTYAGVDFPCNGAPIASVSILAFVVAVAASGFWQSLLT